MSKLAIIPARGGSKRIPKKNINFFLDKPIIAYAIETALNSKLFDEVMVSTDDHEIADIALKYGAKVPFIRSDKNSNDFASTVDVIKEVILSYTNLGIKFEYASCIYPCTPLLSKERLLESFYLLEDKNLDCVFPVIKYGFPIQRAIRINVTGLIEMFQPEHLTTRSQDLEPSFHDAGQFYSFSINNFLLKQKLVTDNTGYIEVSEMEAQDIDNLVDWELAELKYKIINNL
jgi:pseudaminic acid cytidylyltransferase